MSEALKKPGSTLRILGQWGMRLLGIGLLALLLTRVDIGQIYASYQHSTKWIILLVAGGVIPLFYLKTLRWLVILRAQDLRLRVWPSLVAYFSSYFVGTLTPGRLGEFIKAMYVSRRAEVSVAHGFSSVLVDRLFDLYMVMIVGGVAIFQLGTELNIAIAFVIMAGAVTLPLILLLHDRFYLVLESIGMRFGRLSRKLVGEKGLLTELRRGLKQVSVRVVILGAGLTLLSYGLYFGQCYLLARALQIEVPLRAIVFSIAIGGLVTLLPVSISGIGTRDAAIIFYLGQYAVQPETALSFSLLVFLVFYVLAGIIGALAWWAQPIPLLPVSDGGS